MAEFKQAFGHVLKWEGGYSNDPDDRGKETYQGISRNNWPNWRGWGIIDKSKPLKYNQLLKDKHLNGLVEVFYYEHFWKPIQGDKINDQKVANFLFDWYVNSGYHAIKALQRLVNAVPDGVVGPKTVAAINAAGEVLFEQYKASRLQFYKDIVNRRPDQSKFLAGWTNRVNSFV